MSDTRRMTGGEAVVRAAEANGIDTVFGLPGAQIYPLFDALARSDSIRTITSRHEQGAAYMAMGFAKATGRPGAFSVVPGPGVLNTTAALCTAMGCNTPMIFCRRTTWTASPNWPMRWRSRIKRHFDQSPGDKRNDRFDDKALNTVCAPQFSSASFAPGLVLRRAVAFRRLCAWLSLPRPSPNPTLRRRSCLPDHPPCGGGPARP